MLEEFISFYNMVAHKNKLLRALKNEDNSSAIISGFYYLVDMAYTHMDFYTAFQPIKKMEFDANSKKVIRQILDIYSNIEHYYHDHLNFIDLKQLKDDITNSNPRIFDSDIYHSFRQHLLEHYKHGFDITMDNYIKLMCYFMLVAKPKPDGILKKAVLLMYENFKDEILPKIRIDLLQKKLKSLNKSKSKTEKDIINRFIDHAIAVWNASMFAKFH